MSGNIASGNYTNAKSAFHESHLITKDTLDFALGSINENNKKRQILQNIRKNYDCRIFFRQPLTMLQFARKYISIDKIDAFEKIFCDHIMKMLMLYYAFDTCNREMKKKASSVSNTDLEITLATMSVREIEVQKASLMILMFGTRDFTMSTDKLERKLSRKFGLPNFEKVVYLQNHTSLSFRNFLNHIIKCGHVKELHNGSKIGLHPKYIEIVNDFDAAKSKFINNYLKTTVNTENLLKHNKHIQYSKRYNSNPNRRDSMECRAMQWVMKRLLKQGSHTSHFIMDCDAIVDGLIKSFERDTNILYSIGVTNNEFFQRMINCGYIRYNDASRMTIKLKESYINLLDLNSKFSLKLSQRNQIIAKYQLSKKQRSSSHDVCLFIFFVLD